MSGILMAHNDASPNSNTISIMTTPPVSAPLMPDQHPNAPEDLKRSYILDVLINDPRPTFILDLDDLHIGNWSPVYTNPACAHVLSPGIIIRDDDVSGPFRTWASSPEAVSSPSYRYNGKFWTCFDLKGRWRIVGGTRVSFDDDSQAKRVPARLKPSRSSNSSTSTSTNLSGTLSPTSPATTVGAAIIPSSEPDGQSWSDLIPSSPFTDLFKTHDWASTPMKSLTTWPLLLRRSTRFVLADPTPATLFWGKDELCVFNTGYADILADRAEACLGQPASFVWPEIYENLKPYIDEVRATSKSCSWRNIQFLIDRSGRITETYWDWSLIPLMEDKNHNSALYSAIHETTRQFIADRRQESILSSIHTRDAQSFWDEALKSFQRNPWDAPLAAFYDVSQSRRLSASSVGSSDDGAQGYYCVLRGTIGVPADHPAFPQSADMKSSISGVVPYLAEAAGQRESLILTSETRPEFFAMLDDMEWAGFEVPSTTIVIFCLRLGTEIIGFTILGLNPRRPYSSDEHRFIQALDNHLTSSLSAAVLIERSHLTQVRLQDQLTARLSQLEMSDARYRAITELNPLGTINLTPDGAAVYANKTWFDITGHAPEPDISKVDFRTVIHKDDLDLIDREFREMVVNKQRRIYEVRLLNKFFDEAERRWEHKWILATGGPEIDQEGNVISVIGCITDITPQKHAQTIQARLRRAAEEAKAAQERYIDTTSHEMRNPLSAILQSADDITNSLKEVVSSLDNSITFSKGSIDSCIDSAAVISLCAQHQARIINDVLTLSKLDSKLLEVTPIAAQPVSVVQETLHMYAGELVSSEIELELNVEPSYHDNEVDWVFCDPARLKQILINLMGNAIKFTRKEATRRITVGLAASVVKPPKSFHHDLEWFPSQKFTDGSRRDLTLDPEWGTGEPVYIAIIVSDTGKGLSQDEKKKLFNRFAQASTLTHVHYGGSGLGLFISRELTEMQGGEIGVASDVGKGSTFAFYIKSRRAQPAESEKPALEQIAAASTTNTTGPSTTEDQGIVPLVPPLPTKETPSLRSTTLQILLVEDNVVNQKVMTKQLTKAGARVTVANHGQEALDYLEKTVFWTGNQGGGETMDIALVDIEMPVMNGLQCARRVRELQREGKLNAHVPLVAVTANARKEQIEESLSAGMDDFMIKPFRVPDLLAKVEKLLAKRDEPKPKLP